MKFDGTKDATEGFIVAISEEQQEAADKYFDSVQGFSYEGADKDGNEINIVLFANSLTHKAHQTDEYSYISNFIFSNMLGDEEYTATPKSSSSSSSSSGNNAGTQTDDETGNTTGSGVTTAESLM